MPRKKREEQKLMPKKKQKLIQLYLYVIIVNRGQGERVMEIIKNLDYPYQVLSYGRSSVDQYLAHIFGSVNEERDIVFALIEEGIRELASEGLNILLSSPPHQGIGFCLRLTSLIGLNVYHFLTREML